MKRIMKIFIIGVCIGIVALLIQKSFHIDEDVFMRGYYIAASVNYSEHGVGATHVDTYNVRFHDFKF